MKAELGMLRTVATERFELAKEEYEQAIQHIEALEKQFGVSGSLEFLLQQQPKRQKKWTKESLRDEIANIEARMDTAPWQSLERRKLAVRRSNLRFKLRHNFGGK